MEIVYQLQEDAWVKAVLRKSGIFSGLDGSYQLDTTSSEDVHRQVALEKLAMVVSRVHVDDHDQVCEHELGLEIFDVT